MSTQFKLECEMSKEELRAEIESSLVWLRDKESTASETWRPALGRWIAEAEAKLAKLID
jgi:hypothetical protein